MGKKRLPQKIISIVGARPQFIKSSMVHKELREIDIQHVLVHTGQHYDFNMSDIFFNELDIPTPEFNLGVGSYSHGKQTGLMLIECERVLLEEHPQLVLVYGDTNTTLAGAIAASKLKIPLAHVEAGLRSYYRQMPEEINRVLTDQMSELLFAPSKTAVLNLKKESITRNVYNVGDVMLDLALNMSSKVTPHEDEILAKYNLERKNYLLATIHREDNTIKRDNLVSIFSALQIVATSGVRVFFPVHPRTRKYLKSYGLLKRKMPDNLLCNEPVSYAEMVALEKNAKVIVTDSGGVQKESYFFGTPAVIPRDQTEWVELVNSGWNVLTGAHEQKIVSTITQFWDGGVLKRHEHFYGNGDAARRIGDVVKKFIANNPE
jgi:UDP-N-acetylglucosamine 2-epimerase